MSTALKTVSAKLADLRQNPENPRTIQSARLDDLKRALSEDAEMLQARPLIALPDGTVIAGNQRLRAAQELGWETIPTIYVDLDEATARLWMLRDNNEYGEWDEPALAEILASLNGDAELAGFDSAELDRLLASVQVESEVDPDDAPALPEGEPHSKVGEVYELGPHRLMCGDCTDAEQVAPLMAGDHAALLFTSPPYLDARDYGGGDLTPEHLATFIDVCADHADLIAVNLGILRKNNEIVTYWDSYVEAAKRAGSKLLSWNVWDRGESGSIAAATAMFPIEHEFVLVFGKTRRTPNRVVPNKRAGKRTAKTRREADGTLSTLPTQTISDSKPIGSVTRVPPLKARNHGVDHPAMFPVALPSSYIEAVTSRDDLVFDPFVGSGTTIIAADQLGRRCFAMEIDPRYCDVIRQRYADFTSQPDLAP